MPLASPFPLHPACQDGEAAGGGATQAAAAKPQLWRQIDRGVQQQVFRFLKQRLGVSPSCAQRAPTHPSPPLPKGTSWLCAGRSPHLWDALAHVLVAVCGSGAAEGTPARPTPPTPPARLPTPLTSPPVASPTLPVQVTRPPSPLPVLPGRQAGQRPSFH